MPFFLEPKLASAVICDALYFALKIPFSLWKKIQNFFFKTLNFGRHDSKIKITISLNCDRILFRNLLNMLLESEKCYTNRLVAHDCNPAWGTRSRDGVRTAGPFVPVQMVV